MANRWFRSLNLRYEVSGVGEGVLTAERVSRGWVLYLRMDDGRKVYVKKLSEEQAKAVMDENIDAAQAVGRSVMAEKYGDKARCVGFSNPDRHWHKHWALSLGVWVDIGKVGCWRRRGVLVIKRKRGNQWAYYVAEAPNQWDYLKLLEHMPRRRAKMIRKYHYVTAMPKHHLEMVFKRRLKGKIPREDLEKIFNDFRKEMIFVMEWHYVEPHRYKPKASDRTSKEDEGLIGELQSKAEDYGWGEVEEELAEDGEWETIEELKEEGYFDEEH